MYILSILSGRQSRVRRCLYEFLDTVAASRGVPRPDPVGALQIWLSAHVKSRHQLFKISATTNFFASEISEQTLLAHGLPAVGMTPNLFVATQKVFQPHKWFKKQNEKPQRRTEHWESPVPGVYEYIPGRGWYLVATYKEHGADEITEIVPKDGGPVGAIVVNEKKETVPVTSPVPVRYSKVLKKYLLNPDYEIRKKYGVIENSRGRMVQVGFFRLDDGVAWVNCWDEEGEFIPGPYKLWCIDARTDRFRHMLRADDPEYQQSRSNSRAPSRANSSERETGSRRNSQESRSTQYRPGPGSTYDGSSVPSTRANSIKNLTPSGPTSKSGSQPSSRRNSFSRSQRSPRLPLDDVNANLREIAMQQAAKERSNRSIETRKL